MLLQLTRKRGRREAVYVAGGVSRKKMEERGRVCRGRSVAEGRRGKREERGCIYCGKSVTGKYFKEGVRWGRELGT